MAELNFYETGKAAPSRLIRNYSAIYIHQTAKGPITYSQQKFPRGSQWTEIDSAALPVIRVLNDLQNVDTTPNNGDVLAYNSFTQLWISQALPAAAGETSLGNSVFVSSQGKTVAAGAVRESLTNHFSSLTEAVAAAQSGDTVYAYGSHAVSGNLVKQGVKYHFSGKGVISGAGDLIDDLGGAITEIYITGDASFLSLGAVKFTIKISGLNTYYHIKCYNISSTGFIAISMAGGTSDSIIDVEKDVDTYNNITGGFYVMTVYFAGTPKGTLKVGGFIDNHATLGSIGSAVYVDAISNSDFKIIGNIRSNFYIPISTVIIIDTSLGDTFIIEGDIYPNPIAESFFFWGEGTIFCYRGNLTVKGDIYAGSAKAIIDIESSNTFIHVGNLYSDAGQPMIKAISSPKISLKGEQIGTGSSAVLRTKQTGGYFRHSGKVTNAFTSAVGSVSDLNVTAGGTGYGVSIATNNIATTTSGAGVGATVTTYSNSSGIVNAVDIYTPGTGYLVGDTITASGAGGGNAVFTVAAVGISGIYLGNSAGYSAIFDDTLIVVNDALAVEGLVALSNKNVVITNQVASNKPAANITNLVTGSSLFDDPQIQ